MSAKRFPQAREIAGNPTQDLNIEIVGDLPQFSDDDSSFSETSEIVPQKGAVMEDTLGALLNFDDESESSFSETSEYLSNAPRKNVN